MTQDNSEILSSTARQTFELVAEVRDVGRSIRHVAQEVGADTIAETPLADVPPAILEAFRRIEEEEAAVRDELADARSDLESAAEAYDGLMAESEAHISERDEVLDKFTEQNDQLEELLDGRTESHTIRSTPGELEEFTAADGGIVELHAVELVAATPGRNEDWFVDYAFEIPPNATLKTIAMHVANIGWGDGRIDAEIPSLGLVLNGNITPRRTDRDSNFAKILYRTVRPLAAGPLTVRVYYYSRNEQTPTRRMGLGVMGLIFDIQIPADTL